MGRKIAALLCALMCFAVLAGCGGSKDAAPAGNIAPAEDTAPVEDDAPAEDAAPAEDSGSAAGSKYTLELNGVEIAVNAEAAPLAEALGEPTDYFESQSCAFQGLDKVYTYGGVIIRTYPMDGKDYVLSVELRDDTVSTREGVYIGAGLEDVTTAYGEPTQQTDAALRYEDGDCTLAFILTDGQVTGITYTSDAA